MIISNAVAPVLTPRDEPDGTHLVARSQLVTDLLRRRPTRSGAYAYDREAAYLLSVVSAWAYSDTGTLMEMLARQGLERSRCQCVCVSNQALMVDSNAYLIQSECGRLAILGFRGTEPNNLSDLLTGLSVRVTRFSEQGHVHGGFYRAARIVWPVLHAQLQRAARGWPIGVSGASDGGDGAAPPLDRLEALYITGHSLGGALAALTAAFIFDDHTSSSLRDLVRGVYTFGQPMVGDAQFAERCEERFGDILFRHCHANDVVVRLPPMTTGRFRHFGREYASAERGWIQRSPASVQASTALISIGLGVLAWISQQIPLLRHLRLPFSWDDHAQMHYLRICQDAVGLDSEFDATAYRAPVELERVSATARPPASMHAHGRAAAGDGLHRGDAGAPTEH